MLRVGSKHKTTSTPSLNQQPALRSADLEGKAPRVHPLPAHVEPLFEIALECPTVCPEGLAEYITAKVLAHPVPSPKAAVAWLHFACWQVPKVCLLKSPRFLRGCVLSVLHVQARKKGVAVVCRMRA